MSLKILITIVVSVSPIRARFSEPSDLNTDNMFLKPKS